MRIRPYESWDWKRICEIHDAARRDELRLGGLEAAFLSLESAAENEGLFEGTLLVAEQEGIPTGFAAFTEAELTWLYVHPTAYRRGVGRALVRAAIEACAGSISAEVLVGNEPALKLYQSEGFKILRRVDGRLAGNEAFAASGYILQRAAS